MPTSCPRPPIDQNLFPDDVPNHRWDDITQCRSIHSQLVQCLEKPTVETCGANRMLTSGTPAASTTAWYDITREVSWVLSTFAGIGQTLPEAATGAEKEAKYKEIVSQAFTLSMDAVSSIINGVAADTVTNKVAAAKIGSLLATASRVETITGFPLTYLMTPTQYLYQYANPQYIPGQNDLDRMFAANRMSDSQWECYTKAHGNLPDMHREARDAGATRPNINDLVTLYRRGIVTSVDSLAKRMRENGVLQRGHVEEYVALSDWLPGPPDLIRYMVRDVFDEDTVRKFGLDDQFKDKYTADANALGFKVGLSDKTARLEWMSHWKVPSDTSLYTMVQRLYEDRFEVRRWDTIAATIGVEAAERQLGPRPPVFSETDLRYALKVNDNLPTFVDSLVAIQYRPVTNTDASRMFDLGLIGTEEFVDRVRQNGYTLENATLIANYYTAERARKTATATGVWTPRKIAGAYKEGLIDRVRADQLLGEIVLDEALRAKTLDRMEVEADVDTRRRVLRANKKLYLYGVIDETELRARMANIGITQAAEDRIVLEWNSDRAGRSREPRVAMLCDWRDRGMITPDEHMERLIRLGYTVDDATRISQVCSAQGVAKRQRAAAAAAEREYQSVKRSMRDMKDRLDEQIAKRQAELAMLEAQIAIRTAAGTT